MRNALRNRFKIIGLLTLMSIFLASIPIALAEEISGTTQGSLSALGSGYGIGRWPYSDGDVPQGTNVTVRAATTNENVTHVIIIWKANETTIYTTGKINIEESEDTWNGAKIYDAYNWQFLVYTGNWSAKAYFYDNEGNPVGEDLNDGKVAIRAISFHPNVIPEVPYGTIATLITMLGAFYVFYAKRG